MIYPTRLAVAAAATAAPMALASALLAPGRWYVGLAWPFAVLLLTIIDGLLENGQGAMELTLPATAAVGVPVELTIAVAVAARRAPARVEAALAPHPLVELPDDGRLRFSLSSGRGSGVLTAVPVRRGTARFDDAWLRWTGPLGLVWKQARIVANRSLPILPDIGAVHENGARILQRHALQGMMAQANRGDGTDFDALVEFRSGMDRRAIDWKQSARHHKLHAKEFRAERNSQIVFAIDAGRQMSEPVAGLPRVDRAVSAALLAGWVALKLGDRVALTAFDSRPRIASGFVGGSNAFGELQRLAAAIDYSIEETNYSFALTTLGARLTRRSMIVLFTEFTDLTSADLMVRSLARLKKSHLVLIVVLDDEELTTIVDHAPDTAEDVTRAVTAAALLRDRRLVLTRLRHLGIHVVESEYDRVGERLVEGYIDLKRRNLL